MCVVRHVSFLRVRGLCFRGGGRGRGRGGGRVGNGEAVDVEVLAHLHTHHHTQHKHTGHIEHLKGGREGGKEMPIMPACKIVPHTRSQLFQ